MRNRIKVPVLAASACLLLGDMPLTAARGSDMPEVREINIPQLTIKERLLSLNNTPKTGKVTQLAQQQQQQPPKQGGTWKKWNNWKNNWTNN